MTTSCERRPERGRHVFCCDWERYSLLHWGIGLRSVDGKFQVAQATRDSGIAVASALARARERRDAVNAPRFQPVAT